MSAGKVKKLTVSRWRFVAVATCLTVLPLLLVWHVARLQVLPEEEKGYQFLQHEGAMRTVRKEPIPANRGMITDRHGKPLAVSTPVATLVANPQKLSRDPAELAKLAKMLGKDLPSLQKRIELYASKQFMYLERRINLKDAQSVMDLKIDGVDMKREFKRFYPAGEVAVQLVGMTNTDDRGLEGIELAFDRHLTGTPGEQKVLKDLKGNVVDDLGLILPEQPGKDLALSIDLRLQYLAYRELKKAVQQFGAKAGAVVMLDVSSGEVLAMANQPSFNPNIKGQYVPAALRNRAVTDQVEPGSTMKPLTMVAALESGKFTSDTKVDTGLGYVRVGYKDIKDPLGYGVLDLAGILAKSSQVGTSKVALELNPHEIRDVFARSGFGEATGLEFPGEAEGVLKAPRRYDEVTQATLAFGYGLMATPLQIARAYAMLASGGELKQVTLLKTEQQTAGEKVVDADIAQQVLEMMREVTEPGGTGTKAALAAYDVAGKTGTARKISQFGGYDKDRHIALFAGAVPAENPKFVCVVMIDEPTLGESHGGGSVAAPVFAGVMEEALRLLIVPPDIDEDKEVMALKDRSSQGGAT